MSQEKEHLQAIQEIKTMMERSTRFSSISGKAGIVVGLLAVIVFVLQLKTLTVLLVPAK